MALLIFGAIIALSLVIVLFSRSGHSHAGLRDYFAASRQFGSPLLFCLSVGEIYSIGGLLGFPGGIYSHGVPFAVWFLGYILLSCPVGYFLNPWIWRAAKRYDALTLPDLFAGHYRSRALELTVTITSIVFLIPWGTMQFTGLGVAQEGLGLPVSGWPLLAGAGCLALAYVMLAGVRAPAYVSILKDVLMILAIIITALAVLHISSAHTLAAGWNIQPGSLMTPPETRYAMSTLLFQAVGLYMSPLSMAYLFTARSGNAIRRAQIGMPLYMFMFPFLALIALWARVCGPALSSPNQAFIVAARTLLPAPLIGLVAAGAALSGLVVLAGICLAIGPLVSRNLLTGLDENQQKRGAQIVIIVYLLLSIVSAALSSSIMVRMNNLTYLGVTQFLPGVIAIIAMRRVSPLAVAAGIIAGDIIGVSLFLCDLSVFNINDGMIGLIANVAILVLGSMLSSDARVVIPVCRT